MDLELAMSAIESLKQALERLASGQGSQDDQQAVRNALRNKQISLATGARAISVSGDVTDAVFITGDQNIVFSGGEADAIRKALEAYFRPGPGSAPPEPSLVIGRDDSLGILKERLGIGKEGPGSMHVLTAIRGWPGVGKTTVATALAHDPDIESAFPDGVLWTSLGQKPHVLSEMASWGRALGTDDLMRAPTVREATTQLSALLKKKRLLMLVDDVWEIEHAEPFRQARGPECALLVTTREVNVARAIAATPESIYNLPVLTEGNAFKLLAALAPQVTSAHPEACKELVQRLECLPLALQVAGHLLQTEGSMGWGVSELIQEIKAGAVLLQNKAPADRMDLKSGTIPTVTALLDQSTNRLSEDERDCFAYLGAFAPRPATFDLAAMKAVWQVDDARPVVRALVGRGLLEPVGGRFQMHALLVAHAQSLCEV